MTDARATGDYVELHCHSAFSLLDGAALPEMLVARAVELGYPALALTDHDELGGAVRFAQATSEVGIHGIIGAELSLELGVGSSELETRPIRLATLDSKLPTHDPSPASQIPPHHSHIVLLAESREGYGNLSTLVTLARMQRTRGEPSVDLDTLARHATGLFALTGCPRGWVPSLAAAGDVDGACDAAATLLDIFDRRVAIECWDHGLPEERDTTRQLVSIARSLDVPWVVTNDVHYARATDRVVHDVLACLKHRKTLDEMGTRLRPNAEWYLKSAAQMRRRWQHAPEGVRATLAVAERCQFRMEQLAPTLPAFALPAGVSADEYLERLVEQGARERWTDAGISQKHRDQLTHELALIRKLGLAGYFLIVWDIVRFARRRGILCQGRGSAANSAVCFCLGITAVDPIKLGLLFERFLSEDRKEAPDIDIDFAHEEREHVIQYVYEKYGRDHAAMVCEQITYRGRSAVRDVARVLGFSVEQADRLATLSDRFSARATADALRGRENAPDDEETAEEVIARAFGQQMMPGTSASTAAREVKDQAREVGGGRREAECRGGAPGSRLQPPSSPKWIDPRTNSLTSWHRPMPAAGYEPSGSETAHDTKTNWWEDPHAKETHNERRNPTTAFRQTQSSVGVIERAGLDPKDKRVRVLADLVEGLHQLPRHRSIHVGGFVLTAEPLSTVVPIEPASMKDRTVIQWEKDDLDPVGLVKIDVLGLGMLTLIQKCMMYVRQTRGVTVDLAQLDMTDQAVYDDLCKADTIGVFQVESRAQMNTLPRLKPRSFYDLVVEVAIIRPGPIQGDMVHPYLRRRAGLEQVTYPHPSLEPILARTMGVPLFQEQGMQVAIAAAGFTPGEADMLRKAMGHKRSRERMAAICQKLIDGMKRNGIPEETALRIYNQINAFADYGFPESHAASFALLVYASAYLKHYYAPEFTAAILNAQPMGFYAPGTIIEDARRHGVRVAPIDLRHSQWDHTLETGELRVGSWENERATPNSKLPTHHSRPPALRLGLRLINGLGPRAQEIFETARDDGPFTSIEDFVRRARFDRRTLRLLATAGALDGFLESEPNLQRRREALWQVLDSARGDAGPLAPRRVRSGSQVAGRGSPGRSSTHDPRPTTRLPAMSPGELTEADYRMTGVSLNGHPMLHLRPLLRPNGILSAADIIKRARDGEQVAVAGLVICRQRPGTAKGFVFLTLEDETGMVNIVVTPKRFERQALLISTTPLLLVRGVLQIEQTVVNVRGEKFRALQAEVGAEYARSHDFH
ncbi:MAG TPA: PHP domain-containing protein [Gemmatimonadaceae bacterium]|nr:PHP domain-containing protein [Gemmatimonadaceae bacterium]